MPRSYRSAWWPQKDRSRKCGQNQIQRAPTTLSGAAFSCVFGAFRRFSTCGDASAAGPAIQTSTADHVSRHAVPDPRIPVGVEKGHGQGETSDEARASGTRITTDLRPGPVAGDPSPLRRIALNLLTNAVRHNHPDGTATVATGTTDRLAFIEVTNTGPVLDPHEVPVLFEAFQHGPECRSDGSGLALAVARAITLTHQGQVIAHPRPGGGLTVRVELPRHS
ncbi:sensor histidine kinase [Streptomyces sp. NPDC102437]|uniref:sensor histidine kinase n=1 Tax=Streptomyces sp. NPDC102437 TaxID=3366175 RepID=UPI00381D1DA1